MTFDSGNSLERRVSVWGPLAVGLAAGLTLGLAGVAHAKLQCDSDRNTGRQHSATLVSLSVNGEAQTLPTTATVPALGTMVYKTEFDRLPDMVHVEVLDPSSAPSVRKLHVRLK